MVGFPITYGDTDINQVKLSDDIVKLMKTNKFKRYLPIIFFVILTISTFADPSSAMQKGKCNPAEVPTNLTKEPGQTVGEIFKRRLPISSDEDEEMILIFVLIGRIALTVIFSCGCIWIISALINQLIRTLFRK